MRKKVGVLFVTLFFTIFYDLSWSFASAGCSFLRKIWRITNGKGSLDCEFFYTFSNPFLTVFWGPFLRFIFAAGCSFLRRIWRITNGPRSASVNGNPHPHKLPTTPKHSPHKAICSTELNSHNNPQKPSQKILKKTHKKSSTNFSQKNSITVPQSNMFHRIEFTKNPQKKSQKCSQKIPKKFLTKKSYNRPAKQYVPQIEFTQQSCQKNQLLAGHINIGQTI